jgi:hypothetical protein
MATVAGGGGAGASLYAEGSDGVLGDGGLAEEVGAGEHDSPLPGEGGPVGVEHTGDVQGEGDPGEGGHAGDGGRGGLARGNGGASGGGAATCPMH